jgi:hypothetical protein
VPDPNNIPLDVRIAICTDCGAQSITGLDLTVCREQRHGLESVHYELAATQNSAVAIRRVADLQHHGRRLLQGQTNI